MPEQGWEMLPQDAVTHILIKIIFMGLGVMLEVLLRRWEKQLKMASCSCARHQDRNVALLAHYSM